MNAQSISKIVELLEHCDEDGYPTKPWLALVRFSEKRSWCHVQGTIFGFLEVYGVDNVKLFNPEKELRQYQLVLTPAKPCERCFQIHTGECKLMGVVGSDERLNNP